MFDLTEEELIGIYLCVIDSDDSSSDGDEDAGEDGDDEGAIRRTSTQSSIDREKHDWRPVKWTEDSSERHARIIKWITEVAAQQECESRKRAATSPPDDTATSITVTNHPSSVAKRRRTSRESPV